MDSAVYALIVNACIAGLFATAFAIVRMSYPDQRYVTWFVLAYIVGGLTPLSELGVRLTDYTAPFMIGSYGSFLLSLVLLVAGMAALAERRVPRGPLIALLLFGAVVRLLIWNGPRNALWYELAYQAPFVIGAGLSSVIAVDAVRRRRGALWLALAIASALTTAHFLAKPFFAATFGSGPTAKAYASSSYALFSQATGGVLIVTAGLLTLLLVVKAAMGLSISESETDPLTGVANRRGFERRAQPLIACAHERGEPLAAILFDLDHFKRVNDGYGHATGDAVLQAFATMLTERLPRSAVVARLGGEEFVALLDRTTLRGAWLAAQAVRASLPGIAAHLPSVTVSAGLAELAPDDTLYRLIDRADRCSYEAKRTGRNRICPVPEPVVDAETLRIA
ncbi:sensor domain-containing diguanylate cyclase [Sphingomonas panni]|uniref:GGDEF domain-containing protein n=1 Tax=Sphingomonas panni TaxID=237612 RepID=UPI001F5B54FD|nr:GGDEF domain-containing protein [Sphingomonas panni]